MYRAVFTWWCNFYSRSWKNKEGLSCPAWFMPSFPQPRSLRPMSYICWQDESEKRDNPAPSSRQPYALAAKATHNSKCNLHQAGSFQVKEHMCWDKCLRNYLLFYTNVLPAKESRMSNGFSNMAVFMLWSRKIRYSNGIILQVMLYNNVVYRLVTPHSSFEVKSCIFLP